MPPKEYELVYARQATSMERLAAYLAVEGALHRGVEVRAPLTSGDVDRLREANRAAARRY